MKVEDMANNDMNGWMNRLFLPKRFQAAARRAAWVQRILLLVAMTSTTALAQRTATAIPTVVNGFVVAISVTDGGSGYTDAPVVTITGGNGVGATATATIRNGAVDRVIVGSAGNGYTGTPVVSIAVPPPPKGPFSDGLVAYYPFNGNANDESGNLRHGGIVAAEPSVDRFGNPSGAYSFDGSNGGISSAEGILNIGQPEYTISFWFMQRVWDIYGGPSDGVAGYITSHPHTGIALGFDWNRAGYIVVDIGPGNAFWDALYVTGQKHDYATNRWYHVCLVKQGTTYRLFVDGQLDNTFSVPAAANYNMPITLMFGGDGPNFVVSGSMDDVRVYNRALSGQEVKDLFRYESPVFPSVSIEVETVRVTMHVTPGKRYQLVASFDLKTWANVGEPVLAGSSEIPVTLNALSVGRFFRVYEP